MNKMQKIIRMILGNAISKIQRVSLQMTIEESFYRMTQRLTMTSEG